MIGSTSTHQGYWQAQGLVQLGLSRFQAALERGETHRQRSVFYSLANYHGRTLRVLNSGLHRRDEALVQAALHNLATLHQGMMHMHRAAPKDIPLPIVLSEHSRDEFVRDLVVRVLAETPPALAADAVHERANYLNLLGHISPEHIQHHLHALEKAEYIIASERGFVRTNRPYIELDKDVAALRALIGRTFFAKFAELGFDSLRAVDEQVDAFKVTFSRLIGFHDPHTVALFLQTVHMLLDTSIRESTVWRYTDLLHSPYPRPYQRAAYNAFRRGDFHRQIIDAPTGSGKTLVGMMCIQDWLRTLDMGQSILILVPTSNYQQQWIDELCHNPIGLQLPPEIIFSGTPTELAHYQDLTGRHPAILLITYTALSQLGAPTGKGGFDAQSVEMFWQQIDVQHVILDEVHKVVEDMHSVVADVTRLLTSWQRDNSLSSLIGFSGTATAYRRRFDEIGLQLSYHVPIDDLVAAGFVAPFAEMGVPFAFSNRERRIRALLEDYKEGLRRYFELLGPGQLREWFARIPLAERKVIGHEILGMYRGRSDWETAMQKRFQEWEQGPAEGLKLTEIRLVTILQIARGWSDLDLVRAAGAELTSFEKLTEDLEAVKAEMATLVYLPQTLHHLKIDGFTTTLDVEQLRQLPEADHPTHTKPEVVKDLLATTIVGLYDSLSAWYLRTGEGRVRTIKAIIAAEQATRAVSGTIVFDSGRHIPWRHGISKPGYEGLGGLFTELLGDKRFTVMAVLSNEMYLTYDEDDPVTQRIARFVLDDLVQNETSQAIFNLFVSGLDLPAENETELHVLFNQLMVDFQPNLEQMHAARPGAFNKKVLRPLRRKVKKMNLGLRGDRMLSRMDRRNTHLKLLVQTIFDYGLLAVHFREAHVAEVEQVSGATQKFCVVTMPGSPRRKQLMYNLTARIVDAPSLPVNTVLVSNWARTGWNVIRPNLLIDATATRNITAWQQLRGRAIRAWRTWNNDCYRLLSVLVGHHLITDGEGDQEASDAVDEIPLDEALQRLVAEMPHPELGRRLLAEGVSALNHDERYQLAVALLKKRNKVTHIYELVKASGSTSQVTYDRQAKVWRRRDKIAAKHDREISVNPFSGLKTTGDAHAPLIYAQDPRTDVPADLQQHLQEVIAGCDHHIVSGWLDEPAPG